MAGKISTSGGLVPPTNSTQISTPKQNIEGGTGQGFISGTEHIAVTTPDSDPLALGGGDGYSQQAPQTEPAPQIPKPDVPHNNVEPEKIAELPVPEPEAEPPAVPELDALDAALEAKYGLKLDQIVEMLTGLGDFRQQAVVKEQMSTLQNEWGIEFNDRFEIVKQEFEKLSPAERPAYDNVDGAKRLWATYAYNHGIQPTVRNVQTRGKTPGVRHAQPQAGNVGYDFTQEQILAMSPAEYAAQGDAITRAWATGRVLMN